MTEIIQAQFDHIPQFRESLRKATKSAFVKATYEDFLASGLDKSEIIHTRPSSWAGQNKLGEILATVEVHRLSSKQQHRFNSVPRSSQNVAQLSISFMLKEVQTPTKRDCSGSQKPLLKSQVDKNGKHFLERLYQNVIPADHNRENVLDWEQFYRLSDRYFLISLYVSYIFLFTLKNQNGFAKIYFT